MPRHALISCLGLLLALAARASAAPAAHELEERGWTDFDGTQVCIQSCSDGGAYFIGMTKPAVPIVYCAGSQGACAWYEDPSCTKPKPLAVSPYGEPVPCPQYPSSGWCKAAWDVLRNGANLPSCGGGGGGDNANCPTTPVGYPHLPVDPVPYRTCSAPVGGPNYPGGNWFCLQDASGIDSWVPVKRTGAGQIACMSTNSWDCIWTPRECCLRLAASGTSTSPYFECGPLHFQLWQTSGYTDPSHWCYRGWQLVNPGVPVPNLGC
ncbi:hypothetical protein DFJ74DRAFT_650118 [Hyaloraphidium curvatum]|nr:hypothetical protein DFJ74DRAFT_650118 [Hyaloraphidium curvatum]